MTAPSTWMNVSILLLLRLRLHSSCSIACDPVSQCIDHSLCTDLPDGIPQSFGEEKRLNAHHAPYRLTTIIILQKPGKDDLYSWLCALQELVWMPVGTFA